MIPLKMPSELRTLTSPALQADSLPTELLANTNLQKQITLDLKPNFNPVVSSNTSAQRQEGTLSGQAFSRQG